MIDASTSGRHGLPAGREPLGIDRLVDALLRGAIASDAVEALVDGLCRGLADLGLPLWRLNLAVPTIDPALRSVSVNWLRGSGAVREPTVHGPQGEAVYARSPISDLLDRDLTRGRWRLEAEEGCGAFVLLEELRQSGGTDYVLNLVAFSPGTAMLGVAVSFATDRPGGFRDEEVAVLESLLPAIGLTAYRMNLTHTVRNVLGAYLGPMTASRVLAGRIRRGEGEVMPAAILLTDLRSFTAFTDREDPRRVVGWLDEHLETLGEPILAAGGEILKFTGDGFIAVFPVSSLWSVPCAVCRQALTAAEQALAANDDLNRRRRAAGGPELAVDLVLHFGDVVYGNVGTSRRLDFTAIGRAVNEASRIEKLCDELGRHILMSDSFAARCVRELTALGAYPLRGIDGTRRLWTV